MDDGSELLWPFSSLSLQIHITLIIFTLSCSDLSVQQQSGQMCVVAVIESFCKGLKRLPWMWNRYLKGQSNRSTCLWLRRSIQ